MSLKSFCFRHKTVLLIALTLGYLYLRGIGDHGLLDPLEGIHASVGLNAAARGSSLMPEVGGVPYAGKSIGFWWLEALSLGFFGWGEFAVRLVPALSGLGMALASAMVLGRARPRGARLAAVLTGSMPLSFVASQLAAPHALYACLVTFALAGFVRAWEDRRHAVWAHAAAALAFIVQGPEGILLPWLCLYLYSVLTDDSASLTGPLLYGPGVAVSALLVLGYVFLLYSKNPMILTLMGYRTPAFLPSLPLALPMLLAGTVPWTGILWQAVTESWPRNGEDLLNPEGPGLFLLLWAGIFLVFGVLMGDALALVACLPPLAALAGDRLDEWVEANEIRRVQSSVALNILYVSLFLVLGLPVLLFGLPPFLADAWSSILMWAFFVALVALAGWYYARTRQLAKLMRNVSAVALMGLLPLAGAFDLVAERSSLRDEGTLLRGEMHRGDTLVQYAMNRPSLFFYTLRSSELINAPRVPGLLEQPKGNDTALHRLWGSRGRAFLLIESEQTLHAPLPQDVNVIHDGGRVLLLSNRKTPLNAGALHPVSADAPFR